MGLIPMSEIPSEIKLSDLRLWANMFFDLLEKRGHTTIPLKHSYYWSVTPADQLYNPNVRPEFDGLDDLLDNLRDVMMQAERPSDERVIQVLEDYAAILGYIGTGLPFQKDTVQKEIP